MLERPSRLAALIFLAAAISPGWVLADPPPPSSEGIAPANGQHRHVSPPAVEAPQLPPGESFDKDRAAVVLKTARGELAANHPSEARLLSESAIAAWPGEATAWRTLAEACQAAKDEPCRRKADFFQAKVDYANGLPVRVAVLGFQNIAEERPGSNVNGVTFDQATLDQARRLWTFYDSLDRYKKQRPQPSEPSFAEDYPYAPALLAGGVVAGILTGVKGMANK